MRITSVFDWNYNTVAETVINQGGTSSSKTYSILQVLAIKAITSPREVITVVSGTVPALKRGAYRDWDAIIEDPEIRRHIVYESKTDRLYRFRNGSVVEFAVFDDPRKAKSGKRTYLFVNEADTISYEVYFELSVRTQKQVFIDYNPTRRFWVHDELLPLIAKGKSVVLFISTYIHNPFCSSKTKERIESYKETHPMKWRVYGLGLTGHLEGQIYTNWHESLIPFPMDAENQAYGLDFGYTNELALTRNAHWNAEIYTQSLIYEKRLRRDDMIQRMHQIGVSSDIIIIADSEDPEKIRAISDAGFWIKPAKKGDGSVYNGIVYAQDFRVNVCDSPEILKEVDDYMWEMKDGKPTNKPAKSKNHALDSIRYVIHDEFGGGTYDVDESKIRQNIK